MRPIYFLIPALSALIGCSATQLSTAANDAASVLAGTNSVVHAVEGQFHLSAAVASDINQALAAATAADQAIVSQGVNSSNAQSFAAAINAVVGDVAAIPGLPASATDVLTAARVLLPVIETAAGIPVQAGAGSMTPDEARLVLSGAAAR